MKSKADQRRLDAIHNMACICCVVESIERGRELNQPNRTTAHHLVDKGTRELSGGDQATLPLCEWHHLGYRLFTHDNCDMEASWGPSLALRKKAFIAKYGTERELLQSVNEALEAA